MPDAHITPEMFGFLKRLKKNNDRAWFQAHKDEYQRSVRDPLLGFIGDFAPKLAKMSDQLVADPRPVGGSMFRVYRDTRFSNDKTPYKTFAAAQFRHRQSKDVHAPGFYLHLEPGNVFAGAGLWHPPSDALKDIRDAIVDDPKAWQGASRGKALQEQWELAGDSLKRAPRGYDQEHPAIVVLMRKDFILVHHFSDAQAFDAKFLDTFASALKRTTPFMRFLTEAVGLPW